MKKIIILLIMAWPLCSMAQKTHTVAAKETLFSIGRLYNVHPRALAEYNHIPFDKGLSLGQVLKIPSSAAPMPQTVATAPEKPVEPVKTAPTFEEKKKEIVAKQPLGASPVFYVVQPKEGLYGISKKFNTSIENIKKWNNLSGENLTIGEKLIVGFEEKNSVAETPIAAVKNNKPVTAEPEEKKQAEPITQVKPEPVQPIKKIEPNTGFFSLKYEEQARKKDIKSQNGIAGTFKSTSGWEDGKYYCLYNTAPAGSIVKITSAQTQKTIYAKVLDVIPEMKQNDDLTIIVSNAAAASLGDGETNFNCSIQY